MLDSPLSPDEGVRYIEIIHGMPQICCHQLLNKAQLGLSTASQLVRAYQSWMIESRLMHMRPDVHDISSWQSSQGLMQLCEH